MAARRTASRVPTRCWLLYAPKRGDDEMTFYAAPMRILQAWARHERRHEPANLIKTEEDSRRHDDNNARQIQWTYGVHIDIDVIASCQRTRALDYLKSSRRRGA